MLVALGPGGTRELAERALEHARAREAARMVTWPSQGSPMELVGTAEVCLALGVTKQWLGHVIAGRRPVPAVITPRPIATLTATPVWSMADWRGWAERNHTLLPMVTDETGAGDPFADTTP